VSGDLIPGLEGAGKRLGEHLFRLGSVATSHHRKGAEDWIGVFLVELGELGVPPFGT